MKTQVFVFMGMVASGKSYLAEAIVKKTGCAYFNSDSIRKELAGLALKSRQWLPVDSGIYSPEMSRKTYDLMIEKAKLAIEQQVSLVIIDGSYNRAEERTWVKKHLKGLCELCFVYCYCSTDIAYARMNVRGTDTEAVSDGRPLIYEHQQKTYQLPTELEKNELINIDTDANVAELVKKLLK